MRCVPFPACIASRRSRTSAVARVYIARHGETTWNAVGRYQGRLESPLSPLGCAQARAFARALTGKGIVRVISSPLSRCVQTALPLAAAINVPVVTNDLLLEIAHGTWEGRYRDEIARTEPELYYEWREHPERVRFENGESLGDVFERWRRFVASFDASDDTVLVTHDVVVRVAILEQTGRGASMLRSVRAANGAFAVFSVEGGRWELEEPCVDEHLAGLAADIERQAL